MAVKGVSEFHTLQQIQTNIAKQVVLEDPAREVASIATAAMQYVPCLLFFREGPAVVATVEKLRRRPDVLIVHGCDINHPRFAGIASHVGVILNTSTVGVSKKSPLRGVR